MTIRIHPTAEVSGEAQIGDGTSIWHQAQVREGAQIGEECIIGKGVYIGADVSIGDRVKIQNYVSVYEGLTIADGVMVGPHVCFTNDLLPRAIDPEGNLKGAEDWELTETFIGKGAGIGANVTIRCGVRHWRLGYGWRRQCGNQGCAPLWPGLWQSGATQGFCLCPRPSS